MANEEKDSVLFTVAGENGHWTVHVRVLEEMERVLIASSPGVNCPENRRAVLCEFLNRLNWSIMQGNFDMDMNDGKTRFRTCLDCVEQPLTESLLDLFFCLHFTTLDHYFPSLMRVIYGQLSAEETFRLCILPKQDSSPVRLPSQHRRQSEKPMERRSDSQPDAGRE
ncbi:MAG TPA: YbjN domain-containing protein, partial [Candidatus Sumerlaeota bacterium]|nr:YbjN domain-containing protein [Candidatus Sumerlaeota bacterium]